MKPIFVFPAAVTILIIMIAVGSWIFDRSDSLDTPQSIEEAELENMIAVLNSGPPSPDDFITWRLLAVYSCKIKNWELLGSILTQKKEVLEHPPTLAVLYLECRRSDPADYLLDIILEPALNQDAAAYILLYGFEQAEFDTTGKIMRKFPDSVDLRLQAGKLLQKAVTDRNRRGIRALNGFCYYFDRESGIQIAVHIGDIELIRDLEDIDLEERWRNQLGLTALFAGFDDLNLELCRQIFEHFSLSRLIPDKERFNMITYRQWYHSTAEEAEEFYEAMISTDSVTILNDHDADKQPIGRQEFIDGIRLGDLSSVEVALSDLRQDPDIYANALISGCVIASDHKQEVILERLLELTDDRLRAAVILMAAHTRDLNLLTTVIELPLHPKSRFIQSQVGRLMEYAVMNQDIELFAALLKFKHRDRWSFFGMTRSAVYAVRHGDERWVDAILQDLHILELTEINRLLLDVIGAALETERFDLAFSYWRKRFEMNQRSLEIEQNCRRDRQYQNDNDRVGTRASERYLDLGFAIMMLTIPATESLPELLDKISQRFHIDRERFETELLQLESASPEFWTVPERDPVPKNIFLPDYCKQKHPDQFPEFANTPPLPLPNGWHELGKAVFGDLKEWAKAGPQFQRISQGVPDHMRPVNT